MSISSAVSDPCRPMSVDSYEKSTLEMTAWSPRQATTTSPSRGLTSGYTAPNNPRPIASSRVSTSAL